MADGERRATARQQPDMGQEDPGAPDARSSGALLPTLRLPAAFQAPIHLADPPRGDEARTPCPHARREMQNPRGGRPGRPISGGNHRPGKGEDIVHDASPSICSKSSLASGDVQRAPACGRARSQSAATADRRDLSLLDGGPCDVKGRRHVAATSRCLRAVGGRINRTKASPAIPRYRGRTALPQPERFDTCRYRSGAGLLPLRKDV